MTTILSRILGFAIAVAPIAGVGAILAVGGVGVYAGTQGLGPGYIDSLEDVRCLDAGTLIQASCGQQSLSCECDAATYFESKSVVPLTGRAETNFDANVRWTYCRSQANATCDCWALCAAEPD